MLKPELQDEDQYADSLLNLVEAGKLVAKRYFKDGCIERACPPLKALLEIMANGSWEGKGLKSKEFRSLFKPEAILESEWYLERLETRIDVTQNWTGRVQYLANSSRIILIVVSIVGIEKRLMFAKKALSRLESG